MNSSSNPGPKFEIVTTSTGVTSIRNNEVDEIMHNPVGPCIEAQQLYVEQSKLQQLFNDPEQNSSFILFDVGLGAAANAALTLTCIKNSRSDRKFKLISFERDLELLQFTLTQTRHFEHLKPHTLALTHLLERHEWQDKNIHWQLRHGDFLELISKEHEKPHLVFYDPYSPAKNQEMWTTQVFKEIKKISRTAGEGATTLLTYSLATRVRSALMAAGFYVGRGSATGLKTETTVASTELSRLEQPLGLDWLGRWQRSHVRFPFDCLPMHELEIQRIVEETCQIQMKLQRQIQTQKTTTKVLPHLS